MLSPALLPWALCAATAAAFAAGADRSVGEWLAAAVALSASAAHVHAARNRPATRAVSVPLAIGSALYGLGWLTWCVLRLGDSTPQTPSPADPLWLGFYPLAVLAVVLPMRRATPRVPRTMWLDVAAATLAVAAVGAEFVVLPVTEGASGSSLAVATSAAYPSFDLLLAATITAAAVVVGWTLPARIGAIGVVLLAAGDYTYFTGVAGAAEGIGFTASLRPSFAMAVFVVAARVPLDRLSRPADGVAGVLNPALFAVVALAMIVLDRVDGIRTETFALATAAVGAALARLVATVRVERALRRSRRLALTDDLTRLPNRRALTAVVERRIAAGEPVALVVLDLDGFKEVNDSLGHVAGDELLRLAGRRLARVLPRGEALARLGGDEFAAVVEAGAAEEIARALLTALASPFEVGRVAVHVGASAGVARSPEHGTTPFELLRRADEAMYRAKGERGTVAIAVDEEAAHGRLRVELLGELRAAIEVGEVVPHYQIQVCPADGSVVGVEALARWEHPRHGLLTPDLFLPGRAQGSLGRALTRAMVRAATEQAAAWRAAGLDVPVSVNLCAADLADDALATEVVDACVAHGLPTSALRLEVTETVVMADPEAGIARLRQLREAGTSLALDDFGTQHSSLSYLDEMPVDELKVDRGFVDRLDRERTARIVASTIALASDLGLRTVAEGVEDAAQGEALAAMGVDALQGYLFSRPVPAEEVLGRARQRLAAA